MKPHTTIFDSRDPMWNAKVRMTMPLFAGAIVDPSRIEAPVARRDYIEQWRAWCVEKLPHEIPSFIGDLFLEEQRLRRRYDMDYADEDAA